MVAKRSSSATVCLKNEMRRKRGDSCQLSFFCFLFPGGWGWGGIHSSSLSFSAPPQSWLGIMCQKTSPALQLLTKWGPAKLPFLSSSDLMQKGGCHAHSCAQVQQLSFALPLIILWPPQWRNLRICFFSSVQALRFFWCLEILLFALKRCVSMIKTLKIRYLCWR